eukprot:4515862-Pyramimonas_sp.AAC.1
MAGLPTIESDSVDEIREHDPPRTPFVNAGNVYQPGACFPQGGQIRRAAATVPYPPPPLRRI